MSLRRQISRRASPRTLRDEGGFTLIEVLVVILIMGILASIAIAAYLAQTKKGQDVEAKAAARNLVSQVEGCAAEEDRYNRCDTAAELGSRLNGLDFVDPTASPPAGKVTVSAAAANTYTIKAGSKSGHEFTVERVAGGTIVRTCVIKGRAGCRDDGGPTGVW